MISPRELAGLYQGAHDLMRNGDGLQPLEAFDELLKYLLFKERDELSDSPLGLAQGQDAPTLFTSQVDELGEALQRRFGQYVAEEAPWASQVWPDHRFHLSEPTLLHVHELLVGLRLTEIPFDIRSAALTQFLSPGIRRGLGIYLTPDDVVRMVVGVIDPRPSQRLYDPACGSGTFLVEAAKSWRACESDSVFELWGSDMNARMLMLAQLNLGHSRNVVFRNRLLDAIAPTRLSPDSHDWPDDGQFDVVMTNPPFGVVVDSQTYDFAGYETCKDASGYTLKRQQSEIVFIERCLKLLRPGGTLGIVVPRSVITNKRLDVARYAIGRLGYVFAVVGLPPETFAATGTQVNTAVLFMRRFGDGEDRETRVPIAWVNVRNVGFDSTGRARPGNELPAVAESIRESIREGRPFGECTLTDPVAKSASLSELSSLLVQRTPSHVVTTTGPAVVLGDLLHGATTGRTPPRSSYSESGLFLVKVRNFSGNGVSWTPSDRNYVSGKDADSRLRNPMMLLQPGDLILTSSAHSPVYIARKVDIVTEVPEWVGGKASFVAEVMMLRPDPSRVDPLVLLAYLRMPATVDRIQLMVRGQTAHLNVKDLLDLEVPDEVISPSAQFIELKDLLRREADLALEQSNLAWRQRQLLGAWPDPVESS